MLDFRINTFLSVCKHMNFTRAAEELNITQPAVSQHIRFLEEHYQVKLFHYEKKKIMLTEAGTFLLNTSITMQHDDAHLRQSLAAMDKQKKQLTFGVTLTVGEYVIPASMAEFLKENPDITVKMVVTNTQELLKKLDNGDIDFALVEGFFAKNEYDYIVHSTENYIGVCGPAYKLKKTVCNLEDTLGERLMVREAGSGTRDILEKFLETQNLKIQDYRNMVEINNINAIKTLVSAGCGITFLYEVAVKRELKEGTLQKIDMGDFQMSHDLTFIWRRNSKFSDYYRELFEQLL